MGGIKVDVGDGGMGVDGGRFKPTGVSGREVKKGALVGILVSVSNACACPILSSVKPVTRLPKTNPTETSANKKPVPI